MLKLQIQKQKKLPVKPSFSCVEIQLAHAPHLIQPASPRPQAQFLNFFFNINNLIFW